MKPSFEGIDITYKSKADNKDIRDLLEKLVPKAADQLKSFSKQFKAPTTEGSCRKIFDYLKTNFRYIADKDEQIIKLPSALLKYKVGDCKSYSLFTAGILENLNIPYNFVYASYNENPIPHHVYVETLDGCKIDAVYGIFNKEKKANFKYKKNMNVRYMAGIGCNNCEKHRIGELTLISKEKRQAAADALKKATQTVKTTVSQGTQTVKTTLSQGTKTVGLAPGRALFMLLIQKNVDGIASKISQGSTTDLLNRWYSLGGDRTKLTNAIKEGASKPEKKVGFLPKLKKIIGSTPISSVGIGEIPGELKALIVTACTGVATAIGGPEAAPAGAALGAIVIGVLPSILGAIKKVPDTDSTNIQVPQDLKQDYQETVPKNNNTLLYVGGGALLLGAIYMATKKK